MNGYVPGYGPSTAKLAVVGEAPGGDEVTNGRPFMGATGKIVRTLLEKAGVHPDEAYMTNVVKVRPPANDLGLLRTIGHTIEEFIPQLRQELQILKPNAILAVGELALHTLTGERGITKHRGSIFKTGYGKVIASLHPASLLHKEAEGVSSWKDLVYIQWDFDRAVNESRTSHFEESHRMLHVCRSTADFQKFLDRYKSKKYAAVDIETFRTVPSCVGIAFSRYEAMSVPLFNIQSSENPTGISRSETIALWKMVAEFLADPTIMKIGQNFKFDKLQLWLCNNMQTLFGMRTASFFFDTQLAFRILYPELPSKLEFITSVLTREHYYKDEGKEFNPKKDKIDKLLLYNARDAVVTFEVYEEEMKELNERGLAKFFFERVMTMGSPYEEMEHTGWIIDKEQRKRLREKYEILLGANIDRLREIAGHDVNVASNGVKGQVHKFLFGELGLPHRKDVAEKTLQKLAQSPSVKKDVHKKAITLVLQQRKIRKTIGTYINAKEHPDGRMRTGFNLILETGRTATRILQQPVTTEKLGMAFQVITKRGEYGSDLKSMYVPDPGFVIMEPDLSQAEDRVVCLLARDEIGQLFYKYKVDRHRVTSGWILDTAPDDLISAFVLNPSWELAAEINAILKQIITDDDRQAGKKFRHSANYDIGERTAAINAEVSVFRARKFLAKTHTKNPNIRGVFHKEVIEALQNNDRILRNPFGRERQFFNKWGDELFKEAYAQLPQSTVADQCKFAMIRVWKRFRGIIRLYSESHDSFTIGVPFAWVDRLARAVKEELEQPINFALCSLPRGELIIPCDIKISDTNWEDMRDLK